MVVLLLAVSSLTAGEVSEQQAMAQLIHLVVVIDCPEIGYPKLLDITIKPGTTVTSKGTTGIEELKDGSHPIHGTTCRVVDCKDILPRRASIFTKERRLKSNLSLDKT